MEQVPLIFRLHFDSSVLFDKEPKSFDACVKAFYGPDWSRTSDPYLVEVVLSQLSYGTELITIISEERKYVKAFSKRKRLTFKGKSFSF